MKTRSSTNSARRQGRRRPLALSAALALLGLTLTASAAFGGFDKLAQSVRDHVYCKVVRDCVYEGYPNTKIADGPDGVTDDATPTFRFQSDENQVKYRCRIDGRPFHTCRNPYTSYRLKDGDHVLDVYALDRKHNADPTPASREFTVDTDGPNCHIYGPKKTRDRSPRFDLHSNEKGSKFQYRLDRKGKYHRTDDKLNLRNLKRGKHVLEVRSIDKAGNADRSPDKRVFQVVGKKHHGHGHGHGHHH